MKFPGLRTLLSFFERRIANALLTVTAFDRSKNITSCLTESYNLKIFHGSCLEDQTNGNCSGFISILGQSTHVHCVRQPNMSHAIKKQYKKNEQNRHFCHNKCSGIFGEEFQGFYDDELMYETELGISTIKSLLNGKVLRPHSCYIRALHCEIYLWLAESAVFLISTK